VTKVPIRVSGRVVKGYGAAGTNLAGVLGLIEARSGLAHLIPNTLNLELPSPYYPIPDFIVTAAEYGEDLHFTHCTVRGVLCLIMRPASHNTGAAHGPAYLELMSTVWLRDALGVTVGDHLSVDLAQGH
jgi:hypothetical protein